MAILKIAIDPPIEADICRFNAVSYLAEHLTKRQYTEQADGRYLFDKSMMT